MCGCKRFRDHHDSDTYNTYLLRQQKGRDVASSVPLHRKPNSTYPPHSFPCVSANDTPAPTPPSQRVAVIMHYFATTDVMFIMHSLCFTMGELHPITPEEIRGEPHDTTEYTRWYNSRAIKMHLSPGSIPLIGQCPNYRSVRPLSFCPTAYGPYAADHFKTWKKCGVTDPRGSTAPLGKANCKALSFVHNGPVSMWRSVPRRALFPPWAPGEDQDFNARAAGVVKGVLVLETPLVCYTTPWSTLPDMGPASGLGGSCTKSLASIKASLPTLTAKAPWPALDTKDTKFVARSAKLMAPVHPVPVFETALDIAARNHGGNHKLACKEVAEKYNVIPHKQYGRLQDGPDIHEWTTFQCDKLLGGP